MSIDEIFRKEQTGTDALVAGFYLHRRRNCVDMPVRIAFEPPADPVTGEMLDRSPRWQVFLTGELVEDICDIWPVCSGLPIDKAEHDYLLARVRYARAHSPDDAFGAVGGRIDLLTAELPF